MKLLVTLLLLSSSAIADSLEAPFCENEHFRIEANFAGGDLDKCKFKSLNSVELTFRPEDRKVDDAFTWFAFRVTANEARDMNITLRFPNAYARYWPKLSKDGENWLRASQEDVALLHKGKHLQLRARVDESGLWVSAQELLTSDYYDDWFAELRANDEIKTGVIGKSVQDRPIHLAKTATKPEAVIFLGRQHPAEVPGALAMREFVGVVLGDSELARQFRKRFTLIIIPLINPDGVANGHSRHNAGRIDLNRDWGPFSQPETRSVANALAGLEELDIKLRLMLDFHATKMSPTMLFYHQIPEEPTDPLLFSDNWLAAVRNRIGNYEFIQDARPTSDQANSKNYFFNRYGIPSITYELGDRVDRQDISKYTHVFAEEMMREMLLAD
jgi:hypothetical protein